MSLTHRALTSAVAAALIFVVGCASTPVPAPSSPLPTSATAGDTTIVAIAPAGKSACSVWDILGLEQAARGVCGATHYVRDCIAARLGMRFPFLEPTPAVKLITDPANLSEDAPPAVKTAAEVKMKEDQAEQKIKGIRYLATIGCGGCYPDVEEALLDAMEDCTEAVRFEAVVAIRETTGRECAFCSDKACCSQKVQDKLIEMTSQDLNGCYNEPSARVRRQARLALAQCGPVVPVYEEVESDEGESVEPAPEGAEPGVEPELPPDEEGLPAPNENEVAHQPVRLLPAVHSLR